MKMVTSAIDQPTATAAPLKEQTNTGPLPDPQLKRSEGSRAEIYTRFYRRNEKQLKVPFLPFFAEKRRFWENFRQKYAHIR